MVDSPANTPSGPSSGAGSSAGSTSDSVSGAPPRLKGKEPVVEVRQLTKAFGDVLALDHVDLTIYRGEFFSLLGPSGCGKTTLLRCIAGLEEPTSGELLIGGKNALGIPAFKRPVNTVFQSYALFPHMTVRQNVGFGLRMKQLPKTEIAARVDKIMETVQITRFADRKPAQLSGGQRQRVALARAVVNEPEVLLLDEPLGALDLKLRKELQVELLSLQRRLGITFVCVTHDQEEALVMSDRIAVVNQGKIEQLGDCENLYEHPKTCFVSNFLGSCNLLKGSVKERKGDEAVVETEVGTLQVKLDERSAKFADRPSFTLAIRPEKVSVVPESDSAMPNSASGVVEHLIYIGSETHHVVRVGQTRISCELMNTYKGCRGFDPGTKVRVVFPATSFVVLSD